MSFLDSTLPPDEDYRGPVYAVTGRGRVSLTWRSTGIQHPQHRSEPVDAPDVALSWRQQHDRSWEETKSKIHADRPEGVPHGRCYCGCGQETAISTHTHLARGRIKGEPIRYIAGHQRRNTKVAEYRTQPRGAV